MISMTATEAARNFSKVLDLAARGETVMVTRAGELAASIVPPHRPNGAAIIAAYADLEPDPTFYTSYEQDREWFDAAMEVRDPWEDD